MVEAGHLEESLQMLDRLLEVRPGDPDLHLLLSQTLLAMERDEDSLAAVHRAIECGQDNAAVLTQVASRCFFAGDLATARWCVDRAKRITPPGFPLKKELKELDRNIARRARRWKLEKRLSKEFNADPSNRQITTQFARHLIHTGRTYTAYHIVTRGLYYHPRDRCLRRLERKLQPDCGALASLRKPRGFTSA